MSKIKEVISAAHSGETHEVLQASREESPSMSDERFHAVLECITKVAIIAAITKTIPELDWARLITLGAIVFILELLYFSYNKGDGL